MRFKINIKSHLQSNDLLDIASGSFTELLPHLHARTGFPIQINRTNPILDNMLSTLDRLKSLNYFRSIITLKGEF